MKLESRLQLSPGFFVSPSIVENPCDMRLKQRGEGIDLSRFANRRNGLFELTNTGVSNG